MLVWPTPGGQKKSHPADRKSIFFAENMQYLQYPSSHWLNMTFATTLFFTTNVRWDHIQQYLPKISAKMLAEIFSAETRLFLAEIFYAEIFSPKCCPPNFFPSSSSTRQLVLAPSSIVIVNTWRDDHLLV